MASKHIKKGDMAMVIAGKDKGKSGEVSFVNAKDNKVLIEGLNVVSKSVKPRSAQEKGGIIKKSAPLELSNVMPICPSCSKPTRVSKQEQEKDGKKIKVRICKHCGASLEEQKTIKKKAPAKKVAPTAKKKAVKKAATKA